MASVERPACFEQLGSAHARRQLQQEGRRRRAAAELEKDLGPLQVHLLQPGGGLVRFRARPLALSSRARSVSSNRLACS